MEKEEKQMKKKKKVMVVIDESEQSYHALIWAVDNHELLNDSSLTIFATQPLHNCSYVPLPAHLGLARLYFQVGPNQDLMKTTQERTKKVSLGLCEKAKSICGSRGVKVETFTEAGDPKKTVCGAVHKHGIDLLVMANNPCGPFQRLFAESLSEYCSNNAKCAVVLVEKPTNEVIK